MAEKLPRRAIEAVKNRKGREAHEDSVEVAAICRMIATARKQSGLSQDVLAERSGVPQAEISRIESGMLSRGPTLLTLVRLARAMGESLRVQFEAREARRPEVVQIVGHVTSMQPYSSAGIEIVKG
ncbi:MAG TPA: helix-turn-helix transcriptional regulator [Casimicrobiaceae bacterium]